MSLQLSTSSVILEHRDLAPPTQGLQGSVCLYRNSLLCEFIAQGTFHCPSVLPLSLLVDGGQEQKVECVVRYGVPQCVFEQSNVLFGVVPLNLTTSKSVLLKNTGKHHAYYTVSQCYVHVLAIPSCLCALLDPTL